MKIIMIVMMTAGCIKNNFNYNNKYKNNIEYYFSNLDKLDEKIIYFVIEKAEEGSNKALFLYVILLINNPNSKKLTSKAYLLNNLDKLIEYLHSNNYFKELGILYKNGIEGKLEPDVDKAIEYYNKAIDMSDHDAAYNLALLYKNGIKGQLEPNTNKAIEYYNIAKEMGHDISIVKLNDLYNKLIEEKSNISINEALKFAFDLYNKYEYKHSIVSEIFILDSEHEEDSDYDKNIMETYLSNIKICYGIILGQKIANDSNSNISLFKHDPINKNLFVCYGYICKYLESLLELLKHLDNHSFVIDCIKVKERSKFNVSESYVNLLRINDNDYFCLGETERYNNLIDIIKMKEQLLIYINKAVTNINKNTDLCYTLK